MKLEKIMQPTQKLEQKTIKEMLDVHPDLLTTNILVQHLSRHPGLPPWWCRKLFG
jgi:hypothetical protein